ncbi:hypothetical protein JHK87_040426 [Glycine soja]|nr:hypothetical protein JHK87_040426 [Glycine soja]
MKELYNYHQGRKKWVFLINIVGVVRAIQNKMLEFPSHPLYPPLEGSRRGSHRSRLLRWLLVRAIALEVADTEVAFIASVVKGAEPTSPPVLLNDRIGFMEMRLYGDVVLRYVSYKDVGP